MVKCHHQEMTGHVFTVVYVWTSTCTSWWTQGPPKWHLITEISLFLIWFICNHVDLTTVFTTLQTRFQGRIVIWSHFHTMRTGSTHPFTVGKRDQIMILLMISGSWFLMHHNTPESDVGGFGPSLEFSKELHFCNGPNARCANVQVNVNV